MLLDLRSLVENAGGVVASTGGGSKRLRVAGDLNPRRPYAWFPLAEQPAWLVGTDEFDSMFALAVALGLDLPEMCALLVAIEGE